MTITLKTWIWGVLAIFAMTGIPTTIVILNELSTPTVNASHWPQSKMELVERNRDYYIYKHKATGCYYIETGGSSSSFTLMRNGNNKPYCP